MKKFLHRYSIYLIMAAVMLAVAIFTVLYVVFPGTSETPLVVLPTPVSAELSGETETAAESEEILSVTTDTVKTVLRGLARPESYSRSFTVTSFWTDGSAERTVSVWTDGSRTRIADDDGTRIRHLLLADDEVTIWYEGESGSFHGSAVSTADEYESMLRYEEVLSLPQEQLLSATYEELEGTPCIHVRYRSGELEQLHEIYVSAQNGLLLAADIYEGDALIYQMRSLGIDLTAPEKAVFSLPE